MDRHSPITPAQHSSLASSNIAAMLVGGSSAMTAIRQQLRALAPFPWPVRIEGERGTGKNVAARVLHDLSSRSGRFVRCGINVISAGEGREVGELFGWHRGAFSGAVQSHPGVFEQAHRGTVFLNEIGTASARVQEILLHVLEERTIQRLGEEALRPIDARVVFGTNADLAAAIRAGRFRADLLDRMGIHVVQIPPLVCRIEDLPELAAAILVAKAGEAGTEAPPLHPAEIDRLMGHSWPGNVRELEGVLEHFIIHHQLPSKMPRLGSGRFWKTAIPGALEKSRGDKKAAAKALGVSRKTLYEQLKQQA